MSFMRDRLGLKKRGRYFFTRYAGTDPNSFRSEIVDYTVDNAEVAFNSLAEVLIKGGLDKVKTAVEFGKDIPGAINDYMTSVGRGIVEGAVRGVSNSIKPVVRGFIGETASMGFDALIDNVLEQYSDYYLSRVSDYLYMSVGYGAAAVASYSYYALSRGVGDYAPVIRRSDRVRFRPDRYVPSF